MALDGRLLSNVGVLAAVVEGGTFARAAEALGLTPSGVGRATRSAHRGAAPRPNNALPEPHRRRSASLRQHQSPSTRNRGRGNSGDGFVQFRARALARQYRRLYFTLTTVASSPSVSETLSRPIARVDRA